MSTDLQELETYEEAVDELLDYHRATAKSIWPFGTTLRCPKCGRTQTATVGELADYLAHGWPTCHRETMHIGDPETN